MPVSAPIYLIEREWLLHKNIDRLPTKIITHQLKDHHALLRDPLPAFFGIGKLDCFHRNLWLVTKGGKRSHRGDQIFRDQMNDQINIGGQSLITVSNHRDPADNQVANLGVIRGGKDLAEFSTRMTTS